VAPSDGSVPLIEPTCGNNPSGGVGFCPGSVRAGAVCGVDWVGGLAAACGATGTGTGIKMGGTAKLTRAAESGTLPAFNNRERAFCFERSKRILAEPEAIVSCCVSRANGFTDIGFCQSCTPEGLDKRKRKLCP